MSLRLLARSTAPLLSDRLLITTPILFRHHIRLISTQQIPKDNSPDAVSDFLNASSTTTTASEQPLKWSKHTITNRPITEQQEQPPPPAPREEIPTQPKKRQRKKRRQLRPIKQVITLTPNAMSHLRALNDQPSPKLIRISVQNRGCSGLTYHLEYVTKPEKFDEIIKQDDVTVVIDSKALFSIIGSEMDWIDDKLSSKFVFKNPNSKGTCGCGESFMV